MRYFFMLLTLSFYLDATSPLTLKMVAADSVIDTMLLKEPNKQKVQHILKQLPDLHDTLKERILARYKLQLFSTASLHIPKQTLYPHHTHAITSVAISPDNNYLLTASADKTALLWKLSDLKVKPLTLEEDADPLNAVTFSSDSNYALIGYENGTAYLWDLSTCTVLQELKGHTNSITSVALSKNGQYALTGSLDETVRLWDLHTGQTNKLFEGHDNAITSVALHPNGKHAITGSLDRTVHLWHLETGNIIKTLLHPYEVLKLALSSGGRYVLTGSCDTVARL